VIGKLLINCRRNLLDILLDNRNTEIIDKGYVELKRFRNTFTWVDQCS
jgi:hypothetical protein